MQKKMMILLLVMTLGGFIAAILFRIEFEMERGVMKSEVSADGMKYDFYISGRASLFETLPLVVVFHGGTMSLEEMEELTRFNQTAELFGFHVLYPQQDEERNPDGYWNWFLPENQVRGSGEPALIIKLMKSLPILYRINPQKIYAVGFSAGGAMALTMQILYPDVFSGVAIAAGVPFASASNLLEAGLAMNGLLPTDEQLAARAIEALPYAKGNPIRAVLIHGEADMRVKPEASFAILRQLQAVNDALDDGEQNGSFSSTPQFDGLQDSGANVPYRLVQYRNTNQDLILNGYYIKDMGHQYPRSTIDSPFAFSGGVNFSYRAMNFLLKGIW